MGIIEVGPASRGLRPQELRAAQSTARSYHRAGSVLREDLADALQPGCDLPLVAVPGVFEAVWKEGSIPHRIVKDFGGVTFMLSHTPGHDAHDGPADLDPARARSDYGADVLLHGHTHHRSAVQSPDGLVTICPGHLKADADRGQPAGFAVLELHGRTLQARFYDLEAQLLEEHTFHIRAPLKTSSRRKSGSGNI